MAKINQNKKIDCVILAAVFLGYLIFNGILLARHELWRDEANVWLMAKELSPIQLFAEIKYQGHPCLWYLLVMPFAKIGLPFRTISFISFFIMAAAAGVFLCKAPFSKLVKAVALFSPIFTYYYAVISRNYCLIALLLMLLAVYYPKRNEKCILYGLLLGLLVQSDVVALPSAGIISLMWLSEAILRCCKEKKIAPLLQILKGIWIPLISLLLLIAQFYHVSDSPVFQINSYGIKEFLMEVKYYSLWILVRMLGGKQNFCLLFLILILGCMIIVSVKLKNFWAAGVMAASFLFEVLFSVMVYQLHIWHFIALCFVLIWMIWVMCHQEEEKKPKGHAAGAAILGLQTLLWVLSVCMFIRWNAQEEASSLDNALHGVYSDGVYAAEYIKENIEPEALVVSVNVPWASTVLAYLPEYRFYFAGNGQMESYANWSNAQSSQISFEQLLAWVNANFPDKKEFYLLWSDGSCLTDAGLPKECEILYESKAPTARGEEYTIYHIMRE